jgi:hypothetical protein
MDADIPASYGYEAAETSEYRKLFLGAYNKSSAAASTKQSTPLGGYDDAPLARFCQMTCTQFAYSQIYKGKSPPRSLPALDSHYFKVVFQNRPMNVRIYKVVNPLPRVFFPTSWSAIKSSDESTKLIFASSHNDFDPARIAYIESSEPSTQALQDQPLFRVLQESPEKLAFSVSSKERRLLVCADHYYPGWKAVVDNNTVPIFRINGILRGIFVPAGMHKVVFNYEPQSLLLGLCLAIAGVLIWIITALVIYCRHQRVL